jgi:hypothetical protein
MKPNINKALESLRNIATQDAIISIAKTAHPSVEIFKSNCHIHLPPNFSAFHTVEEAVLKAASENIRTLGAGNYYDYTIYAEFANLARENGIYPLFGLEIICLLDNLAHKGIRVNDPANPGKFYICGKAITKFAKMSPRAKNILGKIRKSDSARMTEMAQRLGDVLSERGVILRLSYDDIIEMVVQRHNCPKNTVYLQERHVAQAYQKMLFEKTNKTGRGTILENIFRVPSRNPDDEVTVQNEIRSHLLKSGKPAFVTETFVSFNEAYELIVELGGIPCYPVLADGANPICEYEAQVDKLIEELFSLRIYAAEFIPIRNKPEILGKYVAAMQSAGFFVTAGTEHNTLDMLPIEPKCIGGTAIPEKIKDIFREGASVLAAHQYLALNNETGFVDGKGELNSNYKSPHERIKDFSSMGSAVIKRYIEKYPSKQGA